MIEWKMQSNGRRQMNNITAYIILLIAVILGTASNSFAKSAQGFTLLIPSIITAVTIVGCMYTLSLVMKSIPVGITYASFAGLCIIATAAVGVIKFNQIPNFYTIIGLILIISGVLIVNLLGTNK
jgi:small multidrug resistance pump